MPPKKKKKTKEKQISPPLEEKNNDAKVKKTKTTKKTERNLKMKLETLEFRPGGESLVEACLEKGWTVNDREGSDQPACWPPLGKHKFKVKIPIKI